MTGAIVLQLVFTAFAVLWAYVAGLNAQRRQNAPAVSGVSPSVSHRVVGSSHAAGAAPAPRICSPARLRLTAPPSDVSSRDLPAPLTAA